MLPKRAVSRIKSRRLWRSSRAAAAVVRAVCRMPARWTNSLRKERAVRKGRQATCFVAVVLVLFVFLLWHTPPSAVARERDSPGSAIDVLGVARKPTCVTRESVLRLNKFFKPRRIVIVTTTEDACDTFKSFAGNVECYLDANSLPGVSKESIAAYLENKYAVNGSEEWKGRKLGGWYLQQFMKMGAPQFVEDLTQYYLVWDLDMLLLRDLEVFYYPENLGRVAAGQSARTVVNVGGARNMGYEYTYHELTGRDMEFASDGTSFVTHWMLIYQPFMQEFLDAAVSNRGVPPVDRIRDGDKVIDVRGSPQWVWKILDSLHPGNVETGFSEYASYGSWVKQHHPSSQHILPKKTWTRHPLGSPWAVSMSRFFTKDGLCCPIQSILNVMEYLGFQYTGFEIGHSSSCRYTDRGFEQGYGVYSD